MKLLACILFVTTSAFAQASAVMYRSVADQSGAVVPGALVTAKTTDPGAERTAVTDSQGHYQLYSLSLGHYEIPQQSTVELNFRMGESIQRVSLSENAPPVSVTTADIW